MEKKRSIASRLLLSEDGNRISVETSAVGLNLVLCIVAAFTEISFLSGSNMMLILDSVTLYLLIAMGLTFVLLSGSVNLSVGSMLSLNCVLFAMLGNEIGMWAVPVILVVGLLEGFLTGLVFNFFKIPSFIATYGMMGVYTSIAVVISGGSPIVLKPAVFRALMVLNKNIIPGVKVQYVLVLLVFAVFIFIQKRTSFGKFVVGIGNSPEPMRHIGIRINNVKMWCYGLSGVSASMGSILLCSRLYAGDPTVGTSYLLLAVAVVIVGGTSLTGGAGGVINTLLGAITISILQNALQIMGVNIYYHSVVIGAVMIVAVAISLDKKRVLVVK